MAKSVKKSSAKASQVQKENSEAISEDASECSNNIDLEIVDGTAGRVSAKARSINVPSDNWLKSKTSCPVINHLDSESRQNSASGTPSKSGSALDGIAASKEVKTKTTNKRQESASAPQTAKCGKKPKAMPAEAEAKEINDEHNELTKVFGDFAAEVVPTAITIGKKLQKIKKAVGHGHFELWVKKHLNFDIRTARRYMAKAKPKRTALSDLNACGDLATGYAVEGIAPKEPAARTVPFKVFSPAATKVLNQPVEAMSPDQKITIITDFERFEPIAMQLQEHPSIFALSWQKRLTEPPARWARKDLALFKADTARAQAVLAEIEKDAEFDKPTVAEPQIGVADLTEGDAI